MSELNVGDYVRTKQKSFQPSQIAKIKIMKRDAGYKDQYFIELDHNLIPSYEYRIYEEDIEKSNPKIIVLIEAGDYVNGVEVKNIDDEWITMSDTKIPILKSIANGLIKTIVTKEQFENISYEVGE